MQAPFLLVSEADWCDSSFELFTSQPKAEEYEFYCPACKRRHEFSVLIRTDPP